MSYLVATKVNNKTFIYLRPYHGEDDKELVGWVFEREWAAQFSSKKQAEYFRSVCKRDNAIVVIR